MKKLFSVLICFIIFNCGFSQTFEYDRQYDKLKSDSVSIRVIFIDGLCVEMMSAIKVSIDTTPISISPFKTITVESVIPWAMIAGDSIIYGGVGEKKINLWSDKIYYVDIEPQL